MTTYVRDMELINRFTCRQGVLCMAAQQHNVAVPPYIPHLSHSPPNPVRTDNASFFRKDVNRLKAKYSEVAIKNERRLDLGRPCDSFVRAVL